MTHAVSVRALDVTLDGTHVLRGVDLAASTGEWVNIIGPNGAGKTTLLRALLGLVAFDGEIAIEGLSDRRRSARARKVAYVPQTPVIPPGMRVADYVLLGRTPHRGVFAAETANDRRIAAEADSAGNSPMVSRNATARERVTANIILPGQQRLLRLDG